MTIPSDYRDICKMLLDATNDDRVSWKIKGTTLTVLLPEFNLEIWSGTDEADENEFVAIGLRDPLSRKFFDNWHIEEGDDDFKMMAELFSAARRRAHRIPEKLEAFRTLLRTEQRIGKDEGEKP
jgi:hypothetical protein